MFGSPIKVVSLHKEGRAFSTTISISYKLKTKIKALEIWTQKVSLVNNNTIAQ